MPRIRSSYPDDLPSDSEPHGADPGWFRHDVDMDEEWPPNNHRLVQPAYGEREIERSQANIAALFGPERSSTSMNDTALIEVSRWQRESTPGPVDLIKYIGKGKLTMGTYASATAAMLASDDAVWINQGDGTYRTQDGRTVIVPVKV